MLWGLGYCSCSVTENSLCPCNNLSTNTHRGMLHSFGLGSFFLISISPFTCETPCPRANYLPLSVYSLLLCEFSCVRCISSACVTLFTGEVRDWQVRVWESSPSVSGPGRRAGWASGEREPGHSVATLEHFQLKGLLYLAISGRWRVVGGGWGR